MAGSSLRKLSLHGSHSRPWFYFDPTFYITQCLEAGVAPPIDGHEAYLRHYLDFGAQGGLSPNPLFDEGYYRRRYPDISREIQIGTWASGFDHYTHVGAAKDFSPSWFFDGEFYKNFHRDLSEENLRFGGFQDRYTHYLLVGIKEARAAHWTVQALSTIKAEFGFPTSQKELCALAADGGNLPNIFRPVFDYEWMKEKYDWGRAVRPGAFIRYYLLNVKSQRLSPSPYFDEPFYLSIEPEVRAAVDNGGFASGYEHFVLHGMYEWRPPFAAFDPHYYYHTNMVAQQDARTSESPFAHFLRNRRTKRLRISRPLAERDIPEEIGKGLYERRCALNSGRLTDLTFARPGVEPDVSIIIIARENYEQTANCIISAAHTTKANLEIIVFDNGSSDDTRCLPDINSNIRYIRVEENQGFTTAVNRAAEVATGRMLLLLNNDLELTPRAIDLALETLVANPTIGAVGAKIVRMHGRLQEGGSIVWRDGTCLGYGRDKDPLDGQVSFTQDVDFCSGCFLAIMRADWVEMGGFDEAYAPAYYEETDFCLRIWQRGKRVVYDPRIVVWHFEYGSSSIREEPLALMRRNKRYFENKHRAFLSKCLPPSVANIERARLRHVPHPRILFIEDKLPDPSKGMGFVRSAHVAQVLRGAAGLVSMLGLHMQEWPSVLPEDRTGRQIEILSNVNVTNAEAFLRERVGVYDIVWLSRTHNLHHLKVWRAACPEFFANVRIVLDTEAIAAVRRYAYAQQAKQPADLADMVLEELEHLDGIGHICTVNLNDRDLVQAMLERRGLDIAVSVLGHALPIQPHLPRFTGTRDIVLIGSYSQPDGPNADGLLWFDRAVRPLIPDLDGLEFVIAGSKASWFAARSELRHHYRIVSDPPDMAEVYRTARLMVAPTRFAAGVPMKVHEAASHGVPTVMTDLLADQLGWKRDGIAAIPTTPELFAAAIQALATDKVMWRRAQALQAKLVTEDCDPARFAATVRSIIVGDKLDAPLTELTGDSIGERAKWQLT